MKLIALPASPFVSKCRMAARHLGLELETAPADVVGQGEDLMGVNPLGKIPALVDGDDAVFDSRVIVAWLNRKGGGDLYPDDPRMEAERMEALADGIADAAVAVTQEKRYHAAENVERSWIDRQWNKVERGLVHAAERLPPAEDGIHAGSLALAATLHYLDLRFEGEWRNEALRGWQQRFDATHPDLAALKPAA